MELSCSRLAALLVIVPLVTTACIGAELDAESEELLAESESALETDNGYLPNALSPNALSPNALSPNALSPNALSPNALSPNALSAIKNPGAGGAMSRELLRYIVSCALRPDQTFSFSWTDANGVVHPEVYRGDLGYAAWWTTTPLGTATSNNTYVQGQITACLAARMNWYGVSVRISLRNNEMASTSEERAAFPVREGAFWGNVFSTTQSPYLRACYSPGGLTRARQLQRDCAAGHLSVDPVTNTTTVQQCGSMQIVGSCDTVCNGTDYTSGFYRGCLRSSPLASPWERTDEVITTFLTAGP
ncbi:MULTISPECIES: hypothetical protein [Sorangium]|uniref:Secreted protein n=1 Tax=Sorangium cellulosum TaxID=56 RepID=A0A4P2QE95_SORCE|nr:MULTISPECIES: hypothetical protein [Sorangium]AUX28095.1 hypothetical protein SOCE836_001630 [Sorangium cellulosum]WCQ87499.1 hypothetical protein NQZ70_00162 [Sorangium sp. Soce836]